MRILWVKAGGLVPPDAGGRIRSYHILRELGREHSITLFTFYTAQPDDQHPALHAIFEKLICLPLALPEPKSRRELVDYLRCLASLEPYNLKKYCRPPVSGKLLSLLSNEKFDVIVCDFVIAAPVIPWETPVPKVLFTHNVEATIWKRHYQTTRNPLWKALSWREWKMMARAEEIYLRRADHVIAVSDQDRDAFLTFLEPQKISVIPTGVDVEFFQPRPCEETANSLVFTGSMDWLPNEDGVLYFVEQILPRIRQRIPEISFTVVGRKPSQRLKELAQREKNVHVTGWVEDVRPFLARGAVYVVPLRIGGGTRLKIFEAMAMAKAVVSTTVGAEGLPVQHGENIFLADNPEEFAARAIELVNSAALRSQVGRAAHDMVAESYGWASVAEKFVEVLQKLTGANPLPHSPVPLKALE